MTPAGLIGCERMTQLAVDATGALLDLPCRRTTPISSTSPIRSVSHPG